MILLQVRALKADSEKRSRNFFEPLLLRLQPSSSKMLRDEVLISVVTESYCRRRAKGKFSCA
jgi:hypothetical protein